MAPRTIRYLGINLTKEVKDLYLRNYRTFMKEIEEDIIFFLNTSILGVPVQLSR